VITEKVRRELEVLEGERKKIEGVVVEISAQAGEEGKLFGSVTGADRGGSQRADRVDRRCIDLAEPIKTPASSVVVKPNTGHGDHQSESRRRELSPFSLRL
jgi:ribosomal protein L9